MTPQPTSSASGAHHFLQGLTDLGIEHVFSNLGTDHVSLIEELARWDGHRHARLHEGAGGATTLVAFLERIDALSEQADERGLDILGNLVEWAEAIAPERA
jgi:hypothetical protein